MSLTLEYGNLLDQHDSTWIGPLDATFSSTAKYILAKNAFSSCHIQLINHYNKERSLQKVEEGSR
jgi:hypothetical protein